MVFTGFTTDDFYIKTNRRHYIEENEDLNDYLTIGNYACPANATVKTLSNCPTESAFTLVVDNACDGGKLDSLDFVSGSWMYFRQELTMYKEPFTKYYRGIMHLTDNTISFTAWYKVDTVKVS